MSAKASQPFISTSTVQRTVNEILKNTSLPVELVNRGVNQTAAMWTATDGSQDDFAHFCVENYCKSATDKEALFQRLCDNFEAILGHNNRVSIELKRPIHVEGYSVLPIDELFAAYDGLSHLVTDMFDNKIAFVVTLNFPNYTLKEKSENAEKWTDLEWGYARLGDLFTFRVPSDIVRNINTATSNADNYISNYNIYMGKVWSDNNEKFWSPDLKLISHWGLRDELKAAYADSEKGLEKQKIIYNIMKRIIDQSIPQEIINNNEYIWYPSSNQIFIENIEIIGTPESHVRYQYLLDNFKAIKSSDKYYSGNSTYLDRVFNEDLEISQKDVERLFTAYLSVPQVKEVAKLISQRLNRKLQPFDIWYNGFKNRSSVSQDYLDSLTTSKYPTKEAFVTDLPSILKKLGFTAEKANFICQHVSVDASVGAGHAWESKMKCDNAMLRTRIGSNGMDYKGYNIGIHEFGHNVEQTFSLHNVPNYFLAGVPNTAFTEAVAFAFQQRDLELLGVSAEEDISRYYNLLDNYWSCYEIMGVSLLDIRVWQWMYQNPKADAEQLKNAVLSLAKDIWNEYYAPVFKIKDQTILAVYSHMIDAPLYLSAYPIGYLISFQLENYFRGKNLGTEVERVFSQGKLIPQYWLQKAVGEKLTVSPFVKETAVAVEKVAQYEKEQAALKKQSKKNKK